MHIRKRQERTAVLLFVSCIVDFSSNVAQTYSDSNVCNDLMLLMSSTNNKSWYQPSNLKAVCLTKLHTRWKNMQFTVQVSHTHIAGAHQHDSPTSVYTGNEQRKFLKFPLENFNLLHISVCD